MSNERNFKSILVTIDTGNIAQQITEQNIKVNRFEIHIDSSGTGPIYIGDKDVNTTDYIPRAVASGAGKSDGTYTFIASENASMASGDYFDLSKIYIMSATADDTIRVQYMVGS